MNNEQKKFITRGIATESEQLFGVVRRAALSHEEQYYGLRMVRYPEARAEDMRRRQIELELSTAWVLARNEAAARSLLISLTILRLPISKAVGMLCIRMMSCLAVTLNSFVNVVW